MIISKTPYRISFFGGGTDFPEWFKENGGAVLSTTIDKYCYISLRKLPPFFGHKHRIVYSDIELVSEVKEIKHPSARECLNLLRIKDGMEIHHDGDLPSRSGLGSSSSFTVGLIHALKAYQGQMISSRNLCDLAIDTERSILGEAGGIQDQISVAHGGFNHISFSSAGYSVTPITISQGIKKEMEESLCLFFTGKSRFADEIESKKLSSIGDSKDSLRGMQSLVKDALTILKRYAFNAEEFGYLLHESWHLKKSLAKEVSNSILDEIYDKAMESGARGGKLLGAGGGGFFLFCVDSYRKEEFVEKMKPLLHVPFRFENGGSQIVLYNP